jgi:hypothetical protein
MLNPPDRGDVALSPEDHEAVLEALRDGRKIDAIKRVRTATGMGLKEAKHHVESLPESDAVAGVETVRRGGHGRLLPVTVLVLLVLGVAAFLLLRGS